MCKPARHFYEFGPFRIDVTERLLLRAGEPVLLPPKVFDTLLALVQQPGRVIGKDELMKQVWPDSFVEEANLAHNVFTLRRALGEEKTAGKYIETIPRRGYRFVATVVERQDEAADLLIVEAHSRSHTVIEEHSDAPPDGVPGQIAAHQSPADRQLRVAKRRAKTAALAAAIFVVLLGSAIYLWVSSKANRTGTDAPARSAPATGVAVKSIAILPFKPMSAGLSDEYLGLGMADALITKLSNIRQVIVRPTSAIARYGTLGEDPVMAGRELKVESVLDGTLQKLDDRIRVTVQLVRVDDGTPLWAEKFDEKFTDLFTVQDAISERVVAALALKLAGREKDLLAKRYTENLEAYQLYLKGRYFWNKWTPDDLQKSIGYYRQAIGKDANYALAYVGLADAYNVLGNNYLSPKENYPKGRTAVARALELDDTLAEAHATMGAVNYFYDWDWPTAEREFKRALELNPNYPIAHELYGYYLRTMGRMDEALAEAQRALALDPLSLILNADLSGIYFARREYDRAIDQCQKALEIDPNSIPALGFVAQAFHLQGRYPEAIAAYTKMISLIGRDPYTLANLGYAYAMSGNRDEAQRLLGELTEQSKRAYVSPYSMVMIHTGLGQNDQAFAWLKRAYEEKDSSMVLINVDPMLDPLRSDPRFTDLLRRVGLAQ